MLVDVNGQGRPPALVVSAKGATKESEDLKMKTIWTVSIHGEPEFASDKYSEAASRYNFLVTHGYEDVEISGAKEDGTPVFLAGWGLLS